MRLFAVVVILAVFAVPACQWFADTVSDCRRQSAHRRIRANEQRNR